jgi:hypothetical protein
MSLCVFISSVIAGFEQFRAAAESAVKSLDLQVIKAEEFTASPTSPQVACLSAVRSSDLVIVLLGQKYGPVQPSGVSATHEEFDEARRNKQVFVFVQQGIQPDERQKSLIREARDWAGGHFTGNFTDEESLRTQVTRAVHRWQLTNAAGTIDIDEIKARALDGLPKEDRRYHSSRSTVAISIVGAPRQAILRPSQLESPDLRRDLQQQELFGTPAIFDPRQGTDASIKGHVLTFRQGNAILSLSEEGAIRFVLSLPQVEGLLAVIEEDVRELLTIGFQFAAQILRKVDPTERLSIVAVAVGLHGSNHGAWRTRAEHDRNPNTMTMSRMFTDSPIRITISPPHRCRSAFRIEAQTLAEDFTVLLKREFQS